MIDFFAPGALLIRKQLEVDFIDADEIGARDADEAQRPSRPIEALLEQFAGGVAYGL